MKDTSKLYHGVSAFIAMLALFIGSNHAFGASNIEFGPTGTESGIANADGTWINMWGPAFVSTTFDANNPPPSGDTTGSIYNQGNWTGDTGGMDDYNMISPGTWFGDVVFNGADYTSIELDFKYDVTNSTITPISAANLNVGFDTGYDFVGITNLSFNPANSTLGDGKWHHLSIPVSASQPGIGSADGVSYYIWNPAGTSGTMDYWMANVQLIARVVPVAPPTMSVLKTVPGLVQFADSTPNYNRQDIRTDNSGTANLTFYGQPGPVTYSWTIASFPSAAHSNFLAGFTLTPDPVASQTYPDPDWSATNVIWVALENNADGTVTAGIAYKTNQPTANGQEYAAPGQLVPYNVETNGLTVPSAVGTWSLTFNNNTNITLTAPNGSSTNVTYDPNVAALFKGYVGAFLYSSMVVSANVGQYCIFSSYKITGVGTPVNENLTSGGLTAPFLELISQNYGVGDTNPPDQIFVTGNDVYWLNWELPDNGFSAVSSPTLQNPTWNDVNENLLLNGTAHWLKVAKTDLPSPDSGFFALLQRQFTQLLVLLPGETNAPGTATGITGTPEELSLSASGGLEPVTVMAVDKNFYPVSGVLDSISLTSTDTGPVGGLSNGNVAMVNGTASFTGSADYSFGDEGTFTITATDETSTNIAPATSSSVTVGP